MILEGISFLLFHLLFPPFIIILTLTLVLASFGKSLGIRKIYVKALLRIFKYAKSVSASIERQKERRRPNFQVGEDGADSSEDEGLPDSLSSTDSDSPTHCSTLKHTKELSAIRENLGELEQERMGHLDRLVSRHNVISRRDNLILTPLKPTLPVEKVPQPKNSVAEKILSGRVVSVDTFRSEFDLSDVLDYVKTGVACIIEDEVTQRFVAEELKSWNLLTRTGQGFEFINWKLTIFWIVGCFIRYCILFPGRLAILIVGMVHMVISSAGIGMVPMAGARRWLYHRVALTVFRIMARSFSAVINFHSKENRPQSDGICVANHTSPIDVVILSCDRPYALVGQSHGGFLGVCQRSLSRAAAHIWFQRSEVKDRAQVARRLKEHVEDPNKLPILIFPEGTCINNTSVMQFKKGSFEVGGVIYPVAIKYDAKFGDAFWNSSENGMVSYLMKMMTSWAIVVDVWYLPPMIREEDEDAIKFAERVKKAIALKGGLVDLVWDGNLKRQQVKSEWKAAQQEQFSRRIKLE